jgi:aminopeptidase-like protein
MYYELLSKLSNFNRCHCGPEMEAAFQKLIKYYSGSRLLRYSKNEVNGWLRPPHWICKKAELTDVAGNVIVSIDESNLSVYSYSPSIDKVVPYDELEGHLLSDPKRPDAICFHFRNQYQHWAANWGFSLPHKVREKLPRNSKYHVKIESKFDTTKDLIQSEFHHQGKSNDTYMFIGHFDHPSQVNDGLAGCIAAYEIIRRLNGRKTRFSYRAFASVEIVGSVFYLDALKGKVKNIKEAMFLGFSGIDDAPLVYQQSFYKKSLLDRIVKFLLSFNRDEKTNVFNHREVLGNDENVFDSVGFNIPTGTLMRWPHPNYHTNLDSMDITSEAKMEEFILFNLRVVDIIENNFFIQSNYIGLPSLANPDIDLYLSPTEVSGIIGKMNKISSKYHCELPDQESKYLIENPELLNKFMQNTIRLADGRNTVLDIAEVSKIPFDFALNYLNLLKDKGLVSFMETSK